MAAIQTEIYDAFLSAGAEEEKARVAARVMTDYPKPEELATKEYIDRKIAELEARIMRALWLQGAGIVGIVIAYFTVTITIIK